MFRTPYYSPYLYDPYFAGHHPFYGLHSGPHPCMMGEEIYEKPDRPVGRGLIATIRQGNQQIAVLPPEDLQNIERVRQENLDAVKTILQTATYDDVDYIDATGHTALHYAAQGGRTLIAHQLLQHRASINQADDEGWAPLHYAAQHNHRHLGSHLVQYGAAINQKTGNGKTALYIAASRGHLETTAMLLQQGALASVPTDQHETALHVAVSKKRHQMAKLLLRSNAQDIVNLKDQDGHTALHLAVKNGDREMIALLLKAGADINARDSEYNTPLHHAVARGGPRSLLDLLLENGADPHKNNRAYNTPLKCAQRSAGYRKITERLKTHGKPAVGQQKAVAGHTSAGWAEPDWHFPPVAEQGIELASLEEKKSEEGNAVVSEKTLQFSEFFKPDWSRRAKNHTQIGTCPKYD